MLLHCLGSGFALGFSKNKEIWSRDRSTDWYDRVVMETFDDEQWLENFRMRRQIFDAGFESLTILLLINLYEKKIDVPKRVAITLSRGLDSTYFSPVCICPNLTYISRII